MTSHHEAGHDGRDGDAPAEDLVRCHLPLVTHLVNATMGRVPSFVNRDDLRSAGLEALVRASRGFDPTAGVPFGAYATARVRGGILDELRSLDWAPRSVRQRSREVETARERLAVQLGRLPEPAQVAEALGIGVQDLARHEGDVARSQVASLEAGQVAPLVDQVPATSPSPEASAETGERLRYLEAAIAELPARLRRVVEGYFLEERPMADLARELSVTESRISQMRAQALSLICHALHPVLTPERVTTAAGPADGVAARRRDAYAASVLAREAAGRSTAAHGAAHLPRVV